MASVRRDVDEIARFQLDQSLLETQLRVAVVVAFYVLQIALVAHGWGRPAAGYYAPSLPLSGCYLWRRYAALVRPQARLLFLSLTIPALKRKMRWQRDALLAQLDDAVASFETGPAVTR